MNDFLGEVLFLFVGFITVIAVAMALCFAVAMATANNLKEK